MTKGPQYRMYYVQYTTTLPYLTKVFSIEVARLLQALSEIVPGKRKPAEKPFRFPTFEVGSMVTTIVYVQ